MENAKKSQKVYVVEIRNPDTHEWEPCSDCTISHGDRRTLREIWESRNPDDKFKTAVYVRRD
jgi:hypothetical protein